MPGPHAWRCASMGNYIFNADVLLDAAAQACTGGDKDFGQHMLPRSRRRIAVGLRLLADTIPGIEPYEEHGLLARRRHDRAYFEAHLDTLGAAPGSA